MGLTRACISSHAIDKENLALITSSTAALINILYLALKQRGKFQKGNLHAWRPGESGNPAGRPKFVTLSEAIRRKLAEVDESDPKRRTYVELIAEHLVHVAAGLIGSGRGSVAAARLIGDRTEGKPRRIVQFDIKGEAAQMLAIAIGCSVDDLPPPDEGLE